MGRNQVIEAMKKGYNDAKAQLAPGAVPSAEQLTLRSAMKRRITVDEARALGEPTEPEVLGLPRQVATQSPAGRFSGAEIRYEALYPLRDLGSPKILFDSEDTDTMIVRRTPHMEISKKVPLAPGDKFKARVYADLEAPREGETSSEITAVVPFARQA